MEGEFICGGDKYIFGHRTIGLPVIVSDLPGKIEVEGYKLSLKSSFHVSLVCIGKIIEKCKVTRPNFEKEVIGDFCKFTQDNDVSLSQYSNEFRFATKEEKRTVIAMCRISNLDNFFSLINRKYGLNVENPPTHVTLYTLQPDSGIFVTDTNDIQKLTKIIPNPLGKKL